MSETLGQLVKERLPKLRRDADVTQDELARAAVRLGFGWRRLTVRDLEQNARKLTVEEWAALPSILELAGCRVTRRNALLRADDAVELTPGNVVDGRTLLRMLGHSTDRTLVERVLAAEREEAERVAEAALAALPDVDAEDEPDEAERENSRPKVDAAMTLDEAESKAVGRLRRRLGRPDLSGDDVVKTAAELWQGRGLTDERERRLGDVRGLTPRQVQAARGFTTRTLLDELASRLTTAREGGHGKRQKAR